MRAFTREATSRLFSPASIIVVPMTVSWPLSVAAPVRNLVPTFTSATSFTSRGFTAAALVDFGDARHGAEQRFDDVFLNFAQFDELFQLGGRFVGRVGTILNVVIKNFAQAGADRGKFRTRAGRQFFQNALQTFSN